MSNKIKEALFVVFGNSLEPINNKASPEAVIRQKDLEKTKACYKKLFNEFEVDSDQTYMTQILEKIWPSGNTSQEKIAYAIAVCQTFLNPKNKTITMSDTVVKKLIAKNLVSIYFYILIIFNII